MSKSHLNQQPSCRPVRWSVLFAFALVLVAYLPACVFGLPFPAARGTFPKAINKGGEVAGYCVDSVAVAHGFLRDANGHVTVFDAPGASGFQRLGTFVNGINDVGTVVGYYIDNHRVRHAFLRAKDGIVIAFDAPDAGAGLLGAPPGHPELASGEGTVATGIDDRGVIAGYFYDSNRAQHGFIRDTGGNLVTIDVPGSADTDPQSINTLGEITGTYSDQPKGWGHPNSLAAVHGFRRSPDGTITRLTVPESGWFGILDVHPDDSDGHEAVDAGDSDDGMLVGHYFSTTNHTARGFVRDSNKKLTVFDVECEGSAPAIISVSPFVAGITNTITIKGQHFGNHQLPRDQPFGGVGILDSGPGRVCPTGADFGNNRQGSLAVTRWTDTEIVVTGFKEPSPAPCPFHAGDTVSINVSNVETGAGPAFFKLTVGSTSKDLTPPHITSITPVYPGAHGAFIISGEGFGTVPTDADSDYLQVWDDTAGWGVGYRAAINASRGHATLEVGRWTPNEIEVMKFGIGSGAKQWMLKGGDKIRISVWNPETGTGPATFDSTVADAAEGSVVPHIATVTPISTQKDQTILIKGQGFGFIPDSEEDEATPFLIIRDLNGKWEAGRARNSYAVMLRVSRWTNTEIELAGFAGKYGFGTWRLNSGDQISIRVWNAQTGAGPGTIDSTVEGAIAENEGEMTGSSNPACGSMSAHFRVLSTYQVTGAGFVEVKGVDTRRPTLEAFTWIWGDGIVTRGWFPQSHAYRDTSRDYILQIVSHEDDGSSDCISTPIRWAVGRTGKDSESWLPTPPSATDNGTQPSSERESSDTVPLVRAIVHEGATSLQLPAGRMYLYGMVTGGGAPSSGFANGPYAQVVNAVGNVSSALAFGADGRNSFDTQTGYYDIGGASISGEWDSFAAFHGSNSHAGASNASVPFQVVKRSLVVVIGLSSSEQAVSVQGIPGLQSDASGSQLGMFIGHAVMPPGSYIAVEHSKVLSAGQTPSHMADLLGVFVFGLSGAQ